MNAVPVDGRRFGEIVSEMYDDVIAFPHIERGAGHGSVVGKDLAQNTRLHRDRRDRRGDVHLHGLRELRDVYENGGVGGVRPGKTNRGRRRGMVLRTRRRQREDRSGQYQRRYEPECWCDTCPPRVLEVGEYR